MLHFSNAQVVFQEVPDEISLAISISGCDVGCKGCHSAYTWDAEYGTVLTESKLTSMLNKYEGVVSCVLFYGGEWDTPNLLHLVSLCKRLGYKVALYTGREVEQLSKDLIESLTYLKVGAWVSGLGGLNSPTTNQRMFDVQNNFKDITYKFRRKDARQD